MIFNSFTFLFFFILFFHSYWWVSRRFSIQVRNALILLGSYIFYGWWDWRFLSLIILSSTADFLIGLQLEKTKTPTLKKRWLYLSVAINLGVLGFFKYFNFFVDSFKELFALFSYTPDVVTLNIILPVGISFYTFQTLSYTIDIYRGKLHATKNILAFFSFVAFFPQLVAGPIERAKHLLPQFHTPTVFQYQKTISGLRLVLWGMFKKVVIADNFGYLADQIFHLESPVSALTTFVGALFFALQIYADFSGYSDIAIGISRMLGFDLKKNFKTPYFASSFRTFWQRWHISLSTWFRDYVYIPLGGNRSQPMRIFFNLMLTFLLSGLWHGANATFLIWGGLHGLVLILERRFSFGVRKSIATPLVFFVICLLWIPFRAESLEHLMLLTASLVQWDFSPFLYEMIASFSWIRFLVLMIVSGLFFLIEKQLGEKDFCEWITTKSKSTRYIYYYGILSCILLVGNFDVKPSFIYFQF